MTATGFLLSRVLAIVSSASLSAAATQRARINLGILDGEGSAVCGQPTPFTSLAEALTFGAQVLAKVEEQPLMNFDDQNR